MATAIELATELHDVQNKIRALKLTEMELIERLAAEMTEKTLEVEGIGVFERRRKTDRKAWQHDELRAEVRRHTQRNVDANGEIESETEAQMRTLSECARFEWRSTALRNLGIDPDEYCEVSKGGYTVQFHGDLS